VKAVIHELTCFCFNYNPEIRSTENIICTTHENKPKNIGAGSIFLTRTENVDRNIFRKEETN